MGTDYNYEVGYEGLIKDFKRYQKQTPKGVSLQNKRNKTIVLKFKINGKDKSKGCNCLFTLDGMVDALAKSHKVAEALKTITSQVKFDAWYEKEILEANQIEDDRITFGEAIKKVEDDFWSRPDRRKRKRDRTNASDLTSWHDTYRRFYRWLDPNEKLELSQINHVISKWDKGTKTYKGVVSAMKKLAEMNRRRDIHEELSMLDVTQTEFKEMQNATLKDFLEWRDRTLGVTEELHPNVHLDVRKAWLWVFSIQVVYGLRIHEVFAIANAFESYKTKDGVTIPALNDIRNTDNILVLEGKTLIDTTTKTGYRLARPNIPPKYPNLLDILDIKNPLIPINKSEKGSAKAVANFYNNRAWKKLKAWDAPTTETHALRHLANINGIQAGIPQEVRAQSMGHTVQMNESVYKKRQSTQTTIDLLTNSNSNAIDFVTALAEAKKLVAKDESKREFTAQLLSIIYQKSADEIYQLL